MKKYLFIIISLFATTWLMAQTTTSATYSAGDIPTSNNDFDATCNGPVATLVVNIPAGDFVYGVDVSYDMTAQAGAWMQEQRSQIYSQDLMVDEGAVISGSGGSASGTESYSRPGLTFANGTDADGVLTFEMRAWRTWSSFGSDGCETTNQFIPNNTWTITVTHGAPPTCAFPSGGTVDNITGETAEVSWTENGTATAWDLEIVAAGAVPTGTPTAGYNDVTNNTNFPLSGLTPITDYEVYVRSDCDMDDTGVSVWVGPIAFSTGCAIFAPYYAEDFSTMGFALPPACWAEADNQPLGTTPLVEGNSGWGSGNFANDAGSDNGTSARFNLWNGGDQDWLISPYIDLTGGNHQAEFDMALTTYSGMDSGVMSAGDEIHFLVTTDDGQTWTTLQTWGDGDIISNTGDHIIIDLTPYAGNIVKFAFFVQDDGDGDYNIHIDNFVIRIPPSCNDLSGLVVTTVTTNTATVEWITTGMETVWDLEVVPAGTLATGIPTHDNVPSNPYTIMGLDPSMGYDVYVRADCGMDDTDVSIWLGPTSFATECTSFTAPFSESFDSPSIPNCWSMSGDEDWLFTTDWPDYGAADLADHTGNGGSYAGVDGSGTASPNVVLTSPLIDLAGLTVPRMTFYLFSNNTNDPGANATLTVQVNDGNGWVDALAYAGDNADWVFQAVDLSAYVGDTVQFQFILDQTTVADAGGDAFENDFVIDDVSVEETPTCAFPLNVMAGNITATSADVTWNAAGGQTNWDIEVQPAGTPPTGIPTYNDVTSNPYTITGLTPSTDYVVYLRADCGMDDTDVSAWSTPSSFTTECSAFSAPFMESFDDANIPECWSMAGGEDWLFDTSWPDYGADDVADHTGNGGNYAGVDGSGTPANDSVVLTSPLIDLTGMAAPRMTFYIFSNNTNTPGANSTVTVRVNDGNGWSEALTYAGDNSGWVFQSVDLSAYVGGTVQLQFIVDQTTAEDAGGNAFENDIIIDDVVVEETPSCPAPISVAFNNITGSMADVSWSASGAETVWDIEVVTFGTSPSGTPTYNDVTSPFTITGLDPLTEYAVYVRADCGMDDTDVSTWSSPGLFTTPCASFIPDYLEEFNDMTFTSAPDCWAEVDNQILGTVPLVAGGSNWTNSQFANDPASPFGTAAKINLFSSNNYDWLVSPLIDLTGGTSQVEFDLALTTFFNPNPSTLGSDDEVHFLITTDGGQNWTALQVWTAADDISYTGEHLLYDLAPYAGNTVQFAFYATDGVVDDSQDNDIFVDNFFVTERFDNDLAVVDILAPVSGCGLGMENISVEIQDKGASPQGGFELGYAVNGVTQTVLPDGFYSGNLASDSTDVYTFSTQYDFSALGTYTIQVWTTLDGDEKPLNDTMTFAVENFPSIGGLPYIEDFETSDGGFAASISPNAGGSTIWELGTPAAAIINAAASGTNAWVTDLSADYEGNTLTFLTSPCIDLSEASADPQLSFSIWTDTEANFDGLFVELSIDGGVTWSLLGSDADPDWYNNSDQQFQGENGGWTTVSHSLDGTAGESSVRIRFVFDSDGSVNNEGVGIDDVSIVDPCSAGFGLEVSSTNETTQDFSNDGVATVTPTVGSGPFFYEWDNGNLTDTATGLSAGTYAVTVTDGNGCQDFISVEVGYQCIADMIAGISYTPESQNSVSMDATVTVAIASANGPYTYIWSTGDTLTGVVDSTYTLENLSTGVYTVNVMDANGCSGEVSIVVTSECEVNLGLTYEVSDESVEGAADGMVSVTPTTGTAPYSYTWEGSVETGNMLSGLSAGEYTVTVSDANGCFDTLTVTVSATCPPSLGAMATGVGETLLGENDGMAMASATQGVEPYEYSWSDGQVGNTATGLAPGMYTVTITDVNDCMETATAIVAEGPFASHVGSIVTLRNLNLSPNPTMDDAVLEINFSKDVDVTVSLVNVIGQTIYKQRFVQTSGEVIDLDLSTSPSGVYFVRLQVGGDIHTERILKQE